MNKEQCILNYNSAYSVLQLPHESIETLFYKVEIHYGILLCLLFLYLKKFLF